MINNRQQNGRRRGRGGPQVRNGNGSNSGPERGNRIDNRARGNAAQLHEKYKNLARDSQMQGDRVMTEYYLQFADHYFRVLSESRSRFDEQGQNPQQQNRRPQNERDEFDGNGYDDDGMDEGVDQEAVVEQQRRYEREPQQREQQREPQQREGQRDREYQPPREQQQREREPRREYRRDGRRDNQVDEQSAPIAAEAETPRAPAPAPIVEASEEPRRRGRPRKVRSEEVAEQDAPPRIEVDRLPPSFASAEPGNDDEGGAPTPRRRRARRAGTEDSNVAA